jgi:AcrR family transcriptional regulator
MNVAVRKHKVKQEMRQLILDAAKTIFLEKGFHRTSLRNIAEQIDYSPGTIYLHFKDKDDIFHALHEEGFRKLLADFAPLSHVEDPMQRLIAMGHVYMDFALQNKDLYGLMFILDAPLKSDINKEKWEMGERTLDTLKQVLCECQYLGYFKDKDVDFLSFMIWSAMHGMCAIFYSGRFQAYDQIDNATLMKKGMEYFMSMIRKY